MILIKPGESFKALSVKSGESKKGEWQLINIAGQGNERAVVYVDNHPYEIKAGDKFTIKSIESIEAFATNKLTNYKYLYNKDGTYAYYTKYCVKCIIEPFVYKDPYADFMSIDDVEEPHWEE